MAWNQRKDSRESKVERRRGGASVRIAALAAVAVLCAAGIVWWRATNDERAQRPILPAQPQKATSIPEIKPATAPQPAAKKQMPKDEKKEPEFVKKPGQMQLPNGKILTFPPPKGDEIRKVYAYGHMYECDSEGNFRDVTKRQLFHTAFEGNFLALAAENKPFIPAFLKGLDQEEVKEILKKNYQPIGDETDEEWAQLKAYDDMRCAALQYMEEGGSFDEFVDYFANQAKKERETNALCLREVMTLVKEGKIVEAKEMATAAAALKEKQGLKPFKLPPHVLEAFDAIQ